MFIRFRRTTLSLSRRDTIDASSRLRIADGFQRSRDRVGFHFTY
jgi:hypothetical protein